MSDRFRVMTEDEVAAAHPFAFIRSQEPPDYVPFSVRYGYQKVSDWARKKHHLPAVRGLLWELIGEHK